MPILTTVDSVRTMVRMQSIQDIDTAITRGLSLTSLGLETALQTSFDLWTGYDIFRLDPTIPKRNMFMYKWRLSNGFVDSTQAFTVKIAALVSDFTLNTKAVLDITSDCNTQYEKGVIDNIGGPLAWPSNLGMNTGDAKLIGNFARVDYTSGFNVTADLYDPAAVPVWLQDAAALGAVHHVDKLMPTLRHPKGAPPDVKGDHSYYCGIVTKHIRYYPRYSNPLYRNPG